MPSLFCCGRPSGHSLEQTSIVDVDQLLQDYIWREGNLPWWIRLRSSKYELEINWSDVDRKHEMQRFKKCEKRNLFSPMFIASGTSERCLMKREFPNTTATRKTYLFKDGRDTKYTCHVEVLKGYQIKGKLDLWFHVPWRDKNNSTASPNRDIDSFYICGPTPKPFLLTDIKGHTVRGVMQCFANKPIEVNPGMKATAKMTIVEAEENATFVFRTRWRVLKQSLSAFVRNRLTNEVVGSRTIGRDVFTRIMEKVDGFYIDPKTGDMVCETEGRCFLQYLSAKQINVAHEWL